MNVESGTLPITELEYVSNAIQNANHVSLH